MALRLRGGPGPLPPTSSRAALSLAFAPERCGHPGRGSGNAVGVNAHGDDERYERGMAKYREVYGADAMVFERGTAPFFDVMIEQLFAEVWTRPALSTAQRRLISMSVAAARGRFETLRIQFEQALRDGDLSAEQVIEYCKRVSGS